MQGGLRRGQQNPGVVARGYNPRDAALDTWIRGRLSGGTEEGYRGYQEIPRYNAKCSKGLERRTEIRLDLLRE